ncbi:DUF6504 family protein [Ornithinimicrobium flavum]|uniref:DUF6504 family protein n=1 Tax=Ornithinimicrobium flavum TaxID=1288636 RepID=UPI0019311078|nr:DUF6504 family protein [Ornithinimicrobium flavum]
MRHYREMIEVRVGSAQEHGVQLVGALPAVGAGRDPVQVPTLFLWRGRVHQVRAVLSQWTQRVPWWRAVGEGLQSRRGEGDLLEQRVWRVEAGAGRAGGLGVYDLVEDEQWWLERVAD